MSNLSLSILLLCQVLQWAEIQARSRKLSLQEFLSLADTRKQEIQATLEVSHTLARLLTLDGLPGADSSQELLREVPQTMEGVVTTVELLQDASQWFPGGSKEMRVSSFKYRLTCKMREN